MKIYLGADFQRRRELRRHAETLRSLGHEVVSSWLWTAIPDSDYRSKWEDCAQEDMERIREADVCVFFTEEPNTKSRGGRHVEYGYALSTCAWVVVIGWVESQFYTLADCTFKSLGDFLEWLESNDCPFSN